MSVRARARRSSWLVAGACASVALAGCGGAGGGAAADAGTLDAADAQDPTAALVHAADSARYLTDLEAIAHPRLPGSPHWQVVQDLCAARFEALGYEVERHHYGSGTNVIGTLRGEVTPDELVVVSAHYDHIAGCDGADDNASGVAGLLETARVLAMRRYARTLVVACWDEEELGLLGSDAWAADVAPPRQVRVAISLEMIGYKSDAPNSQTVPAGFGALFSRQVRELQANDNRGDFIAVVADVPAHETTAAFEAVAATTGLRTLLLELEADVATSPLLGDLQRSDHASFWRRDMPAILVTDTANFRNTHYHCTGGPDTVDRLDHAFATQVVQATIGASVSTLGLR